MKKRIAQPYLINPLKRRKKRKKHSVKSSKSLKFKVKKSKPRIKKSKGKHTANPLMIINPKKKEKNMHTNTWYGHTAAHRKAALLGWRRRKRYSQPFQNAWFDDSAGHRKAALLGWRRRKRKSRKGKRRKMKARKITRKVTRRITRKVRRRQPFMNPMYVRNSLGGFISKREGRALVELMIDGALVVSGVTIGKLAMSQVSERVPFLQKPLGKFLGYFTLGSAVYLIGSRMRQIPARYTNMLAIGILAPAITDIIDYAREQVGIKKLAYADAYIPSEIAPESEQALGAYVPQTLDASYGESEY